MYLPKKEPPSRCQCVFHVSNLNLSIFMCGMEVFSLPRDTQVSRWHLVNLTLRSHGGSAGVWSKDSAARMQQPGCHMLLLHPRFLFQQLLGKPARQESR